MLPRILDRILVRELNTLKEELSAYPDESQIWQLAPGLKNSAGTLALHLAGNLRHFIGAQYGDTGYVRDREAEFATRDLALGELLSIIDATIDELKTALGTLDKTKVHGPYPLEIGGVRPIAATFLVHLSSHLAYHLGQINYHRRMLTGETGDISPLPLSALDLG